MAVSQHIFSYVSGSPNATTLMLVLNRQQNYSIITEFNQARVFSTLMTKKKRALTGREYHYREKNH